ncbi:hypothetical protein V7037_19245 [Priestia megaterium]
MPKRGQRKNNKRTNWLAKSYPMKRGNSSTASKMVQAHNKFNDRKGK